MKLFNIPWATVNKGILTKLYSIQLYFVDTVFMLFDSWEVPIV